MIATKLDVVLAATLIVEATHSGARGAIAEGVLAVFVVLCGYEEWRQFKAHRAMVEEAAKSRGTQR